MAKTTKSELEKRELRIGAGLSGYRVSPEKYRSQEKINQLIEGSTGG